MPPNNRSLSAEGTVRQPQRCHTLGQSMRTPFAKIRAFVNGWNDRCHPFIWTKTADDILKKANRQQTSNTGH